MTECPLNIAIFSVSLANGKHKVGGVDIAVHRLANALCAVDNVTVLSLDNCPDQAIYKHKLLFGGLAFLKSRLGRILLLPFLLNVVDFSQFDVVHFHGDDWFYLFRQTPTVRTMHGSSLMEAQFATSFKRKLFCLLTYWFEKLSILLADRTVAVGKSTAQIYGIDKVIGWGVDTDIYYPGEKNVEPLILFVGTWSGRKRGQFLYDLFVNKVLKQFPSARLCMVSDYCPEHPSVTWEKFPSDEQLAALYRKAWVFAYPSVYEGFGITYLESLASGTAILCSPNASVSEILDHGQLGLIVQDEKFSDQLLRLLTDDSLRLQLEKEGLKKASKLTWKDIASAYKAVYLDSIDKNVSKNAI
ncbi:MAG: glycosyltransferase family 4 protein [Candidatus Obscuribacterales bacterium]|nr:glycosyltransferase family 4 protein [Candidatus Obscuribacterales bacterium]